jgi:hypothetical protein
VLRARPGDDLHDPGLLWIEEEAEADPTQPELLTVATRAIWWTAADVEQD